MVDGPVWGKASEGVVVQLSHQRKTARHGPFPTPHPPFPHQCPSCNWHSRALESLITAQNPPKDDVAKK